MDKSDFYFGDQEQERLPTLHPYRTVPPVLPGRGGGQLLTICGNRGPICVVGMLALSGGCLLPNMEGQRRGGPLQCLGLARPSCSLRGGPSPRPSHPPHAHAQPCPSLSFHQLCIALTVLPDPSLCRQPSTFVCCCIFPHVTRPTQD